MEKGKLWKPVMSSGLFRNKLKPGRWHAIEYVEAVSYPKLEPVERLDRTTGLVAVAVHFGKTRLIDNFLYEGKGE